MSKFQLEVLNIVSKIPRGRVTTYKELAVALGRPRAWRAVANALAKNPHPIRIPCHRVVRADGALGGYKLGRRLKERLLLEEGIEIKRRKVDLKKYFFQYSGSEEQHRCENAIV
jgi:methylated-DNA-[protein]-cysteine S-methyltransferase